MRILTGAMLATALLVPASAYAASPKLIIAINAVGTSIVLHKYMGYELPTKRHKGLDWTLGEDVVTFGRKASYDYALFMYAEDSFASSGRVALQMLGIAGCFVASARLTR